MEACNTGMGAMKVHGRMWDEQRAFVVGTTEEEIEAGELGTSVEHDPVSVR
jgi:hypothetical protein